MNSISVLEEYFAAYGSNVFIQTPSQKITFHEFRKSLRVPESNWITDTDPINYLRLIFANLIHSQTPLLPNLYWGDSQKQLALNQVKDLEVPTPSIGIFTSGSTDTPKLVIQPIKSFLQNAKSANQNVSFSENQTWYLSLPLFHVGGLGVIFRALISGGHVYISNQKVEDALAELPKISHVSMVPTQLFRFLETKTNTNLKALLLGGGPCAEHLVTKAFKRGLPIVKSYGMTETASQIAATKPGASFFELQTSGRVLNGNAIYINSTDKRILISSHSLMTGYWQNGRLNLNTNDQGQFVTNDYGYIENGLLTIQGRLDRIFKCGGENIQPEVIERVLLSQPEILSAHVAPEADAEYGQVPVAYIKTREELISNVTLNSIQDHLRQNLKGFYIPKRIYSESKLTQPKGLKSTL